MKPPLTAKQAELYELIREAVRKRGRSPTLSELRAQLGVGSINTVVDRLTGLEKKGYIVRRKHAKRNIRLVESIPDGQRSAILSVPVLASVGCDDLSVYAAETRDEFLDIDASLVQGAKEVVAVRAVGNSMNDAGIKSGDYVLIEPNVEVKSGEQAAVIVGDHVTVKVLERRGDLLVLRPKSKDPKYKPIVVDGNFKVAGKVLRVIPNPSAIHSEFVPVAGEEAEPKPYENEIT